ncbi:MAG TPA: glycosyltransferase, partial [Planctomycetota bacterium]|nr:glycosyltransferase [Planctomycetota bacterium]
MRIVLVVHGFPPHERTGVETHVAALARALGRRGIEVEVFAPRKDVRTPEFAQRREARDGFHVTWITVNRIARTAEERFAPPGMAEAFGEFLERVRPTLVHFHHVLKLGVGLLEETARRGLPSIYTAHDFFPVCERVILARPDLERCSTLGDAHACARCDDAAAFLDARGRWSDWQAGVLPDSLSANERSELAQLLRARDETSANFETRVALERRRKAA